MKMFEEWSSNPRSELREIRLLLDPVFDRFPNEYLELLRDQNGGEGFLGDNYLILWSAAEVVSLNMRYKIGRFAPSLVLIGSSGGGEAYGYHRSTLHLVSVPFVGMSDDAATPIASSLDEFVNYLHGRFQ